MVPRLGSSVRSGFGPGRRVLVLLFALVAFLTPLPAAETPAAERTPALLQELRSFNTVATLLHIAAHPDDENTALITYFAKGRGYRTAYLSLTRGDGGQNELGPEFDEKLGLARTHELLVARKLDGGRQFFTRAIDFGYSKSHDETLTFWDRKEVLGDVVRIIRKFRPDVIVTRFPIPPGSGGHGHHTASGILAVEAFKLAGDPKAYPEQLAQGLTVWQPKRVLWNGFGGNRGGGLTGPTVAVDIGGNDPVSGTPFGVIAARSRGMHISQGFAGFAARGSSGPNEQTFMLLAGEPAAKDLMDGIDTSWTRYPGGAEIGRLAAAAIAGFKAEAPAASIPALLAIRTQLAALPSDPVIADKRAQLDRLLVACAGLQVETLADRAEVVPGERLTVKTRVAGLGAPGVAFRDLRLVGARGAELAALSAPAGGAMPALVLAVPAAMPLTQPYWLQQDGKSGISRVDDPSLIGTPENAATFRAEYRFDFSGQTITVADDVVCVVPAPKGERRRRVDVIPPVSLRFAADVSVFNPGTKKQVAVEITAARPDAKGALQLELPPGWTAQPAQQPFAVAAAGGKANLVFEVTAPARAETGRMTAAATVGGARFANQRVVIDYAHLPLLLLQPPARARLVSAEVAIKGRHVGYLPGAGDDLAEALEQLGYRVTTLAGTDLTAEKLKGLDAVVIGVRAFNERKDLVPNLPALFAWVEQGGTVVAQYNRPSNSLTDQLGPYPLSIAGSAPALRVTDERSPFAFLQPAHPALNVPNKLGPADFDGWFQERGAYFPSKWDEAKYEPILAFNDPGEDPLKSGVLIARHGKGHYVYTGLAFFRQLPAGVPGAYRLFANLVSLGR